MKRLMWPGFLFVLVGSIVAVDVTMLIVANTRPSMTVHPHYNTDPDSWNTQQEQRKTNARLGWSITVEQARRSGALTLRLVDRHTQPIESATVRVRLFHRANAQHVMDTTLVHSQGGSYHGQLPFDRSGHWQCDVDVQHGADRFTDSLDVMIQRDPSEPTS